MLVYSQNIIEFINLIKVSLKDVLSNEVGLKVYGDRFYDRQQEYSYPINVVVFNDRSMLGYFDPFFYELGFHESLMYSSQGQLQDIIRHELAHYMTFIEYGNLVKPHGIEFRSFCQRFGWGEEVQKATSCIDDGVSSLKAEENSVLRKVQKLMALASSSNKNEAEQAMIKSQQLLLKHNIEIRNLVDDQDEKVFLKRIMKQKKKNAKMRAIANILETFFVSSVYNRQQEFTYLEIVGSAVNIEIAEYVASILEDKLEILWNQARKLQLGLKGTIAKNSFILGVAQGYCDKIQFLKRKSDSHTSSALMIIEKKLEDAKAMVYPSLRKSYSQARHCSQSSRLGEQAGKELNINPGINRSPKNSEAYLTFLLTRR